VRGADSQRFWDRRARENALYFVDNQLDYRSPDTEAFWRGGEEVVDQLLDSVGETVSPGDHVLDIGCGVGRLTRALAARAGRVTGLDVSSEMLKRARDLNPGLPDVEWVQNDGTNLRPVADSSIDLCFSHVVFQHIPDPEVTLGYVREMGRVLKPGGRALFVVSTDPAIHRQRPGLRMRLEALVGRAPAGGDDPAWLGSAVDELSVRQAATDGGLGVRSFLAPGTQFSTVHAIRD
jgi:ubiquinone/menaquinone biosynthesis C-methylase UbiE